MSKKLINKYISDAARHLIKCHHENYRDVSQKLNLSYGFFRQLMSNNRDLTIIDVYEIAQLEHVSINYLFPPTHNSQRGFQEFKTVTGDNSKDDFEAFLKQISS